MTMLGEGLKDTCPVCATTTATKACPSSLHPSTAPTRAVLRLAVAICCCKEDKSSRTSTSGRANNARLFRRRHVYGWLYSTAFCGRPSGNSRVSGAGGPTVGAPMTDQSFHRPVLNWPSSLPSPLVLSPLHTTMWSPFTPIASLAAGLFSGFQHPANTLHGTMTGLNYTDLSRFTPYIEFARAAYCDSNKIAGWKCGG